MAPIRACTFNIRYDTQDDDRAWDARKRSVIETLQDIDPDLLALQEALAHQYDDIRGELAGYEWYGVGREDGERGGELVPVAWRPERFAVRETDAFWLSETPETPSAGWDASLPRVATWAALTDRETGRDLWVVSTHFDHVGREARRQSATLLGERIEAHLAAGEAVVVMGDMNCGPVSDPYQTIGEAGLVDAHEAAETTEGPTATYHAFTGNPMVRIDYVWLSPDATVEHYRTLPTRSAHRSDHLPVVVDVSF